MEIDLSHRLKAETLWIRFLFCFSFQSLAGCRCWYPMKRELRKKYSEGSAVYRVTIDKVQ
jgi:hypothetical protein